MEIFEGTLFDCQMVKNLLENEGIESKFNNEILGSRGWDVFGPAEGVKIIVSDDSYDKAKMIVDEFERSRKG